MFTQKSESFVDSVKRSVESFFSSIQISSADVIRFVSCFGIGFVVGLFAKKYGKYVISALLFITLVLATLQYFDLIMINQVNVKTMLGFQPTQNFDTIVSHLLAQAKIYVLEIGTTLLGFLLGFKFG